MVSLTPSTKVGRLLRLAIARSGLVRRSGEPVRLSKLQRWCKPSANDHDSTIPKAQCLHILPPLLL